MKAFLVGAAFLTLAAAAAAQQPTTQPPAQQPTVQQQFDAATAALDAERWQDALRQFEAIEARLSPGSRRTLAVVRVRKGQALLRLGRRDEARSALELGLRDFPEADSSLDEDRFLGRLMLGEIAEVALNYEAAARHYRAAEAIPLAPASKLGVYRGLIQTQMFADAAAALADADEALALLREAGLERQDEGVLRALRGRALLNLGRHSEALDELDTAMRRLGGLTSRVNLADIVARSDLAIAAMLAGREEAARRYLAYTGAGHHETSFSAGGGSMQPPPCGGELRPDDVAVLEFSVLDDGTVGHVTPIYASRPGRSALVFAAAAQGWAWAPEAIAEIPMLFRMAMRVEIRCSQRRNDRFLVESGAEIAAWYAAHGIVNRDGPASGPLPRPRELRDALARFEAEAGPQSPRLIGPLVNLARHPGVGTEETALHLRRAIPLAVEAGAPAEVIAGLVVHLVRNERRFEAWEHRWRPADYAEILAHPVIRGNRRREATVRVRQAYGFYGRRDDREAAEVLAAVRRDSGLAPDDPILRYVAALEVALAAAREDWASARAAQEALGPSGEPCQVGPRIRVNASDRDFPNDALRWGFEGWTSVEATPSADGDVESARTVLAYPPFVFNEASEQIARRTRVERPYLPSGGACRPFQSTVRFIIPD